MGTLFSYQGRYGAALSSEEDALKTFRELQERGFWLAEILGLYGNALAQVGRSDDAQKSLDEAMNVARELKNQATTAEIQGYQGDIAFYRGDYQAAATLYDEALKTASHASDLHLILVSKFNVAKVAVQAGSLSIGRKLTQQTVRRSRQHGIEVCIRGMFDLPCGSSHEPEELRTGKKRAAERPKQKRKARPEGFARRKPLPAGA